MPPVKEETQTQATAQAEQLPSGDPQLHAAPPQAPDAEPPQPKTQRQILAQIAETLEARGVDAYQRADNIRRFLAVLEANPEAAEAFDAAGLLVDRL